MAEEDTLSQQLEKALAATNKVRVAFCCTPLWKFRLMQAAQERGLTVSEYCELLIATSDKAQVNELPVTELSEKDISKMARDAFRLIADASKSPNPELK